MSKFHGKTALITGSISGIGLAIARSFASEGMRIVVHGLADERSADAVMSELGVLGAVETRFFDADLRDPTAVGDMMDAVAAWGGADILVNNAGMQKTASIEECDFELWNTILAVNLSGAFLTMHRALPLMTQKGYGRVINIASVHGLVASMDKAPYVASKFGLVGLTKVAALEYAAQGDKSKGGITINAICPGWTETQLVEPQIEERATIVGEDRDAGIADLLAEKQPSRRMSDPSEIGQLALWLADPVAHNITGTSIPIDGGWTAQ